MIFLKCLKSWKKYCPDYEIVRWDESNTNLNENAYIEEAYKAKKWAFVTDYVRLNVLYKYGGIYMDTDVELIKPIDDFVIEKAFTGFESNGGAITGILASEKELNIFKELLSYYENKHFLVDGKIDVTTNIISVTNILKKHPSFTSVFLCFTSI